ncbi:MAG: hypothetical protein OXG10_05135 [Candidatus Dadabacteria bacterium]|nr:hypothetical protein [Candidatus Dadabacteria bacterium]
MRLRNLFMILLLCMTVGVFGVSCTGDDGAQGPQGEQGLQGEKGDPGEVTEADIPETTGFYDFLESWGVEDGEVGCGDSVLTGTGPLPGPETLKALTPTERTGETATLNALLSAGCSNARFGNVEQTQGNLDLGSDPADNAIIFYKTARSEKSEMSTEDKEATSFDLASRTTTTKDFVEGLLFAELMNNGPSEAFERGLLHSSCGVGETAPPSIRGVWRAAKIVDSVQKYADSVTSGSPAVTETIKVCVRLDAHPGVTKCYVQVTGPDGTVATDDSATIALYDGTDLDEIVSNENINTGAGAGTVTTGFLFDGTADLDDAGNLCHLFGLK